VISSTADFRRLVPGLAALAVGLVLLLLLLVGPGPSMRFLVLGIGAVGLLLLLQRPALGLVALAALSFTLPFSFGTGTEVALTPPVFLIPALAVAWLAYRLRTRSLRLPSSRTVPPLLLFVASGLLSLLAGNAYWDPLVPRPSNLLLVQMGQWAIFVLSAVAFLLAADLGREVRWLQMATFVFLALGAVVILELYLPPLQRLVGWSQPSMAGRSLFWVWWAGLAMGQVLFNRRLNRLAKLALLGLLLAAGYHLWFRLNSWVSGWVPLTAAVLVVVWLWVWKRSRVMGVLLALLLLVVAAASYPRLVAHAGGEEELIRSWGGRQVLYQATLDLVKERPLLGLGPASYRHYASTQWLSLGVGRALYLNPQVSSHNNFIDVYAQMGLMGLGLLLWFLIELGRLGWRLRTRFQGGFEEGYVQGALAGFVATLVAMLLADWFLPFVYNIGFPGFRTSALAWMFLGGLVALEAASDTRQQGGEGGGQPAVVESGSG
jgi:O-antigen ligase